MEFTAHQDGLEFQSTLPARGATDGCRSKRAKQEISIHAPRTGSDRTEEVTQISRELFQSTLPARGATKHGLPLDIHAKYFNPRSPHGERRRLVRRMGQRRDFNPRSPHGERLESARRNEDAGNISIHAPRTGSDMLSFSVAASPKQFQSTLPARGATVRHGRPHRHLGQDFNPRSPHGERRHRLKRLSCKAKHFNPRSPHGERQFAIDFADKPMDFNPRSPHGERQRGNVWIARKS